jgi:hypothetical protein
MSSFQNSFTPIFIVTSLIILIIGIVCIQFLDRLFAGSSNLNSIRMFGFAVILNINILVFLIMSFSRIKFAEGTEGPQGNKGARGNDGKPAGVSLCSVKYETVQEKKNNIRTLEELDLKNPYISDD